MLPATEDLRLLIKLPHCSVASSFRLCPSVGNGRVPSHSSRAVANGSIAICRPPCRFLAGAVQFAMMRAAERDREFIADLLPKSARLRKTQMVRVAGFAAADEAGLFGHEAQMLFVP